MNSNDALIAWARKDMLARVDAMKKKKLALEEFRDTIAATALELTNNPRKPVSQWKTKWLKADLKVMIEFKRGPFPAKEDSEKLYELTIKQLRELYASKYHDCEVPTEDQYTWTASMDDDLKRLEDGIVEDVLQDTALYRAIERDDEYLVTRLHTSLRATKTRYLYATRYFAS